MRYDPALDGIRAIAVIMVLAYHAGIAQWGYLGVDVFFVLSGYLITRLLTEQPQPVARFYMRRALRLYPALLLMLLAFWAATGDWFQPLLAASYVSNFTAAFTGAPADLIHTWSLSVEEQFYLLWPLALPLICRMKDPKKFLLTAWILTTLWRGLNFQWLGWDQAYFRLDTRASGILFGAVVALGVVIPRWCVLLILPAAAITILARYTVIPITVSLPMAELATAAILLKPPKQLGYLAPIGVLSYGIYLWHLPIMRWAEWTDPVTRFCLGTASSIGLALISYYTVERAGRMLRDHFDRREVTAAAVS